MRRNEKKTITTTIQNSTLPTFYSTMPLRTDSVEKARRIELNDYFGNIKSLKLKKNYVLTEDKIKNYSLKCIEKRFKFRNSKETPSEYLRHIFKILKQKEKTYVEKRKEVEKMKNSYKDFYVTSLEHYWDDLQFQNEKQVFLPERDKKIIKYKGETLDASFVSDEFDFEHKIDYLDSQIINDEERLKDSLIYDKLKTKYKFYLKPVKITKYTPPAKPLTSHSSKKPFFEIQSENKKLISNIDKNLLPNLRSLRTYNKIQNNQIEQNKQKADKLINHIMVKSPENKKFSQTQREKFHKIHIFK